MCFLQIGVTSEVGKGSCFAFTLACTMSSRPDALGGGEDDGSSQFGDDRRSERGGGEDDADTRQQAVERRELRVLLTEDNAFNR